MNTLIYSHCSLPSTPTEPDPEPDVTETEPKLIPLMEVCGSIIYILLLYMHVHVHTLYMHVHT